jgi:hypothetical protein
MGNAAGSVHKRIRCPRCFKAFKTDIAVLKHQEADPVQCRRDIEQSTLSSSDDDIDKHKWATIEEEISRRGFEKLLQSEQESIDHWVLKILGNETSSHPIEERKWKLRKWNMAWRILFPGHEVPTSPCGLIVLWSLCSN